MILPRDVCRRVGILPRLGLAQLLGDVIAQRLEPFERGGLDGLRALDHLVMRLVLLRVLNGLVAELKQLGRVADPLDGLFHRRGNHARDVAGCVDQIAECFAELPFTEVFNHFTQIAHGAGNVVAGRIEDRGNEVVARGLFVAGNRLAHTVGNVKDGVGSTWRQFLRRKLAAVSEHFETGFDVPGILDKDAAGVERLRYLVDARIDAVELGPQLRGARARVRSAAPARFGLLSNHACSLPRRGTTPGATFTCVATESILSAVSQHFFLGLGPRARPARLQCASGAPMSRNRNG